MYIEHLLSRIRDELFAEKITKISRTEINDFYKHLHQVVVDVRRAGVLAQEYFFKYLKRIVNDAEVLMKLRFIKAILGFSIEKDSFDENILKNIRKAIEFMSMYMSGLILTTPDGKVVVKILRDTFIKRTRYRSGDIAVLNLEEAFACIFMGGGEPVKSVISELDTQLR